MRFGRTVTVTITECFQYPNIGDDFYLGTEQTESDLKDGLPKKENKMNM